LPENQYSLNTDTLRVSHEKRTAKIVCFLAKSKSQSISIFSTYIVFLTKMQKRQTLEKGSALFKNDITTFELALK